MCLYQSCSLGLDLERELCLEVERLFPLGSPENCLKISVAFLDCAHGMWHGLAVVEKLRVDLEEEIIDGNKASLLLPLLRDDNQVVGVDEHLAHLPLAVALRVHCL